MLTDVIQLILTLFHIETFKIHIDGNEKYIWY